MNEFWNRKLEIINFSAQNGKVNVLCSTYDGVSVCECLFVCVDYILKGSGQRKNPFG